MNVRSWRSRWAGRGRESSWLGFSAMHAARLPGRRRINSASWGDLPMPCHGLPLSLSLTDSCPQRCAPCCLPRPREDPEPLLGSTQLRRSLSTAALRTHVLQRRNRQGFRSQGRWTPSRSQHPPHVRRAVISNLAFAPSLAPRAPSAARSRPCLLPHCTALQIPMAGELHGLAL